MKPDQCHLYLYGPGRSPLDTTFEAAANRLESLEKLYFEPDGSFVWSAPGGSVQIFGMLYDAAEKLQYVDLRIEGTGHSESREMFLAIVEAISPRASVGQKVSPSSASGGASKADLAVLLLPEASLHDFQSFVLEYWG